MFIWPPEPGCVSGLQTASYADMPDPRLEAKFKQVSTAYKLQVETFFFFFWRSHPSLPQENLLIRGKVQGPMVTPGSCSSPRDNLMEPMKNAYRVIATHNLGVNRFCRDTVNFLQRQGCTGKNHFEALVILTLRLLFDSTLFSRQCS